MKMHQQIKGPHVSDDLAGVLCGRDGVENSTLREDLVTCKDCLRIRGQLYNDASRLIGSWVFSFTPEEGPFDALRKAMELLRYHADREAFIAEQGELQDLASPEQIAEAACARYNALLGVREGETAEEALRRREQEAIETALARRRDQHDGALKRFLGVLRECLVLDGNQSRRYAQAADALMDAWHPGDRASQAARLRVLGEKGTYTKEFRAALEHVNQDLRVVQTRDALIRDAFRHGLEWNDRQAVLSAEQLGYVRSDHVYQPAPVPMILYCPTCNGRHIDKNEYATKPHHTHACQHCGTCWRPAVVPTVGVQFLPGFKDPEPDAEVKTREMVTECGDGR